MRDFTILDPCVYFRDREENTGSACEWAPEEKKSARQDKRALGFPLRFDKTGGKKTSSSGEESVSGWSITRNRRLLVEY